jgi:hypothetical protein
VVDTSGVATRAQTLHHPLDRVLAAV